MGKRAVPVILAILLAASLPPAAGAIDPLAPASTVEEARERLRYLQEEPGRVDAWVENNWKKEFAARYPELASPSPGGKETAAAARERDMKSRIAQSDLKEGMRKERREWLEKEMQALLSRDFREELPVRLGPYDADRGEYPILLGFGWPTPLLVRLRVAAGEKEGFAIRFPRTLPATLRINEKGEASLLALDWGGVTAESVVSLLPPGPRLLWQGSHESWVTSVAFRPDGSQVLSAGADGMITAWDAPTGNRVWRLEDAEMALAVAYSPDGSTFVTGGADSFLRMRDAETGREIWREQASGMIFAVAYSPDGRHVASGDDGGILRVRNAQSGREILRADLGSPVRGLDYSRGGRSIAAGTEGRIAVLWEVVTGRQIWRKDLEWPVYSVAMNGEGLVAIGGGGKRLQVVRQSDGVEVWNRALDGEIRSVRFDPSGRILGAGGSGYHARVFLAETGEPMWAADVESPVRSLAFGPRGLKLAVGSADFSVRLFEVDEGNRVIAAFCSHGRLYVDRGSVFRIFRPSR